MLMHVSDADRAFDEMVRVIRPGGRLSVFDFDWETQFVDSPCQGTTRLIMRSFCDSSRTVGTVAGSHGRSNTMQ